MYARVNCETEGQHLSYFMGIYQPNKAGEFAMFGLNKPNFKLILNFTGLLVTCKNEEDQIKKRKALETPQEIASICQTLSGN